MERSFESVCNQVALGLLGALVMTTCACEAPRDVSTSDGPGTSDADLRAARTSQDVSTRSVDQLRVEWPDRSQLQTSVLGRMPAKARAAAQGSTLPVLVLQTAGLTEGTELAVRPMFYAASIHGEGEHAGIHINVSASKLVHRYPGMPRADKTERVRGDRPAWVMANEGIWSVTWDEHGVSYVVEVECEQPYQDARCKNGDHAMKIANELAFVGGTFGAAPQHGGAL